MPLSLGRTCSKLPGKTGFVGIESDGNDSISSVLAQSTAPNGQMRLRISRNGADAYGGENLLITPYSFGMSMEYLGILQVNTALLGVGAAEPYTHMPGPLGAGFGGVLNVFNETDTGAMWITCKAGGSPPATSFGRIICQTYAFGDGGPMQFITRGASGFQFMTGANGLETTHTFCDQFGRWVFAADSGGTGVEATVSIYPDATSLVGLNVFALASQAANALQVVSVAAGPLVTVDGAGGLHPGHGGVAVGAAIWSGSGAPSNALGSVGDFYLRSDSGGVALSNIYNKTGASAWTGIA